MFSVRCSGLLIPFQHSLFLIHHSLFLLILLICESVAKNQRFVCLAVKQLLYVFLTHRHIVFIVLLCVEALHLSKFIENQRLVCLAVKQLIEVCFVLSLCSLWLNDY